MANSINKNVKITGWATAWAFGALILSGGTAFAGDPGHMKTTGITSQPIGHYDYCKTYPADCKIRSSATSPAKLTRKRWAEMVEVNSYANRNVIAVTDLEYYKREEYWAYPDKYGDCEDYVLLKRKLLMDKGWKASDLLITVLTLPDGSGHAVLTVRTDRADYSLDNLNDKILPWNETEYLYLKRQSEKNSGKWITIVDRRRLSANYVRR